MRTKESRRTDPRMPLTGGRPEERAALLAALERFRLGEELHSAAAAEGVPSWRLLEAAQAMPAPGVTGLAEHDLQPFIRRR